MAVHEVGHHPAEFAAAIAAAEAVDEFVAHLSRRREVHAIQHAEKIVEQNIEALVWREFADAGQGVFKHRIAVGVCTHGRRQWEFAFGRQAWIMLIFLLGSPARGGG